MVKAKVLISEPCLNPSWEFLPYVWASLKTYADKQKLTEVQWLDPIYRSDRPSSLLQNYEQIDVLGLSCYTWNWPIQMELAKQVKYRNPDCLVVAGGPEVPLGDTELFSRYPFIDIVVKKDGEETFYEVLGEFLGNQEYHRIGNLLLPQGSDLSPFHTHNKDWFRDFKYSPYLEQSDYFYREFVRKRKEGTYHAVWETNRGCPYSCTFCDWGSATYSKIRPFDSARVEAEAEWLGRSKVGFVFQTDANFGFFKRDIEIAEWFAKSRRRYGFPISIYYSPAKNSAKNYLTITKILKNSGVKVDQTLSIQHTDSEVLSIMERKNLNAEEQAKVLDFSYRENVPLYVQLIIGSPGDTLLKWKKCLADLTEMGVHTEYRTLFYCMLPNAPAASPEFRNKYAIQTIKRYCSLSGENRLKKQPDWGLNFTTEIIVGTRTYSTEDWVEMCAYSVFYKSMHNFALTRFISMFLRMSYDVSYNEFYQKLYDFLLNDECMGSFVKEVRKNYQSMLREEHSFEEMEYEEDYGWPRLWSPDEWLFLSFIEHMDDFYDAVDRFLQKEYDFIGVRSCLAFQRNMMIHPGYSGNHGFYIDYDWLSYFDRACALRAAAPLDTPKICSMYVQAERKIVHHGRQELTFYRYSGAERMHRYFTEVIGGAYARSDRTYIDMGSMVGNEVRVNEVLT